MDEPNREMDEDFAALLEGHLPGAFRPLAPGDTVQGRIVEVSRSAILVDVGQRSEGALDLAEFRPEELAAMQPGQTVECRVLSVSAGGIRLTRGLKARDLDLQALREAARTGLPVEGRVEGTNAGGFTVALSGSTRGFVPRSQMDLGLEGPQEVVGRTLRFKVLEVRGRDVVLSHRALVQEEQAEQRQALLSSLEPGQVRSARVVRHESFGAFLDLGSGLTALLPLSEVSWTRGAALPPVGAEVQVRLLKVETQGDRPRISASLRQAGPDPWSALGEVLVAGGTVTGTVTRLSTYGAFVSIAEGIEGLLHVSEITSARRLRSPSEVLQVGQSVTVQVLSVDPVARKVSLSLKALEPREEAVAPEAEARLRVEEGASPDQGRRWSPAAPAPTPTAFEEALRRALGSKRTS